ncbi:uncharacterized protein [Physcomitrium patens]|uniref:Uncharacterized protein n=1 Tax=Physcomitrium patens TaxID=3218 RepID=A0A2K1IGK1_PHYPA|nr:hypothetical protein PHYPA_028999 [Physcomitrium patens]
MFSFVMAQELRLEYTSSTFPNTSTDLNAHIDVCDVDYSCNAKGFGLMSSSSFLMAAGSLGLHYEGKQRRFEDLSVFRRLQEFEESSHSLMSLCSTTSSTYSEKHHRIP